MKKLVVLFAGSTVGIVIGTVASLLLEPKSAESWRKNLQTRWQAMLQQAQQEQQRTEQQLQNRYPHLISDSKKTAV